MDFTKRQIEIMNAATKRIDEFGIQNLTIKNLAADLNLSEPALYRHFKSKNDILLGMLTYFIGQMKGRLDDLLETDFDHAQDELRAIFKSQLETIVNRPSIISILFSEGIFSFDQQLNEKVKQVMDLMQFYILENLQKGQSSGHYTKTLGASVMTTIIVGSMRLTVLKWKMSRYSSNLIKDGMGVLDTVLKMISK
jgi:TetR/AcrR family transcriptional regulator, fatty acid metabolism regulator protein